MARATSTILNHRRRFHSQRALRMSESGYLLPLHEPMFHGSEEDEANKPYATHTETKPPRELRSFKRGAFDVLYAAPTNEAPVFNVWDTIIRIRAAYPDAHRLFSEIFIAHPAVLGGYLLLNIVITLTPVLSLLAASCLLIVVENHLQAVGSVEALQDHVRVCGIAWISVVVANMVAEHELLSAQMRLKARLREQFLPRLIAKSLELDLPAFDAKSLHPDCPIPSEYWDSYDAPCFNFVLQGLVFPLDMLALLARVFVLAGIVVWRGWSGSWMLLVFAILQPLGICFCRGNITRGEGFALWTENALFYRRAALHDLASNRDIRRTLMKDNTCAGIAQEYAEVSAALGPDNIAMQDLKNLVAFQPRWFWSLFRAFVVDQPTVLFALFLPWTDPISSLVSMLILQQTTQTVQKGNMLFLDSRCSFDAFIEAVVWPKEWFYNTLDFDSTIPSGVEMYPPALASNAGMKIEFRNVSFAYPSASADSEETSSSVLKNLSFTIEPGSLVVVVGDNGSGKSSLLGLLTRTWTPTSGQILIDDKPVERYALSQLRGAIAAVEQDENVYPAVSLSDSVMLGVGRRRRNEENKIFAQAARMGCATKLLAGFDDCLGWDTVFDTAEVHFTSDGLGLEAAPEAVREVEKRRPRVHRQLSGDLHPEKWAVKDTSVNVAGAFHQAATDMTTPNNAWASGLTQRSTVHRGTSQEYESQQASTTARRLAAPPSRLNARKTVSKQPSIRNVPDSEAEESQELNTSSTRGKSPFDSVLGAAKRAITNTANTATFYVRQRTEEPDEPVEVNGSYEYTAEERDIQNQSKRATAAHKRNRISMDNKAYRPSHSDLEDEDEDFTDDDGKKKKRKKKKKESTGGPLSTLPVAGYDKRKKKARKSKGNADEMKEGSDSDSHATELQSAPRGSVRRSIPPESTFNNSLEDAENGLDSIPEVDDEDIFAAQKERPRSRSRGASQPPRSPGAVFGTLTYSIFTVFMLLGRALGTTAELICLRPIRAAARKSVIYPLLKLLAGLFFLFLAWNYVPLIDIHLPSLGGAPVYRAPEVPASNIAEIAERLRRMEAALSGLSLDSERTRAKVDEETRINAELAGKVGALETRVDREKTRALEAEVGTRDAAASGIKAMKKDMDALQALVQAVQSQPAASSPATVGSDEEARTKLKAIEERLGTVEGSVREAIDAGKKNAGPGTAVGSNWWGKSDSKSLTVKTSDGRDVSKLISDLVNHAVGLSGRDIRADFAQHSSGGMVYPELTSDTYHISPSGLTNRLVGFVTGNGYLYGRPPVWALQYDIHDGHCWPFAGEQGQLGVILAGPVYIEDITIDHVSKESAVNMRSSAPRDMEVWALVEGQDNLVKLRAWREERVRRREAGETVEEEPPFPQNAPGADKDVRTFPIDPEIKALGIDFAIVVLRIRNNWGMKPFTCLYRFRVHGTRADVGWDAIPEELLSA
ncbi:hypothetical protein MKEN_00346100 [Mycena kentingensis (nom. inval.)]|nr:hypothetical protein MKEN_00346100 [Mycena kentingensis (nom. inval.)]